MSINGRANDVDEDKEYDPLLSSVRSSEPNAAARLTAAPAVVVISAFLRSSFAMLFMRVKASSRESQLIPKP
jgi:hypothetical protein